MTDFIYNYYLRLNIANNNKNVRKMTISNASGDKCHLSISVLQSKPIITLPDATIMDKLTLFDVDVSIGEYKTFTFKESTITSIKDQNTTSPELRKDLTQQEINDYLATRLDIKGLPLQGNSRYIPYITVFNPVLKTDMTIFIDKLHGDMFYISGLQFLLSDAVDVADATEIEVMGYSINGRIDITSSSSARTCLTPSQAVTYDTGIMSDFGKHMNFDTTQLWNADPDVKAYGVAFTKELPSTPGTNFPIIYDKVIGRGGTEVQVCRQDSVPSVVVNLGKIRKLYQQGTTDNNMSVYGWLLYCSHLTRVNILPNGIIKDKDAIISVILDLY